MPSNVYERAPGRWGARCKVNGRMLWLGTHDSQERAWEVVDAARGVAHEDGEIAVVETVAGWWQRWPEIAPALSPRSIETIGRTRALSGSFIDAFGGLRLDELEKHALVSWALDNPNRSRYAKTILEDAVTVGLLERNPMKDVKLRTEPASAGRVPDAGEVTALYWELGAGSLGRMALTSAYSGLRLSEAANLRHSDVWRDERGTVWANVRCGKGGKPRKVVVFEPAAGILANYVTELGDELLFSRVSGRPWTRKTVNRRWVAARERAGIADVRFHDLRKFHATWLVDRGASDLDVAIQLGHSDNGELVRKVYAPRPDKTAALERLVGLAP